MNELITNKPFETVNSLTIETHPVQCRHDTRKYSTVPKVVSMRAYEVYCNEFGEQKELITNDCRGGFSIKELISFLYARSFPKEEWHNRIREALKGMDNL